LTANIKKWRAELKKGNTVVKYQGGFYRHNYKNRIQWAKDDLEEIRNGTWVPKLTPLKVGTIGRFKECQKEYDNFGASGNVTLSRRGDRVTVLQVLGDEEAMIEAWGKSLYLSGVDTSEWVGETTKQLPGIFIISGTKTYTTVMGSSKTVFEVKPYTGENAP
jgi:hypothetical protein